jgi:hypothetical protein
MGQRHVPVGLGPFRPQALGAGVPRLVAVVTDFADFSWGYLRELSFTIPHLSMLARTSLVSATTLIELHVALNLAHSTCISPMSSLTTAW